MRLIHLPFLLTLLIVLSACVSTPTIKPPLEISTLALNQAHLQHIAYIQHFTLHGRIGVQTNSKGFSGSMHWQHLDQHDQITLYSPLGGQVASLYRTPEQVILSDEKGNSISASDAESLTQTTLGWKIPLTGLADWALGRPSAGMIKGITWNEQGLLTTLQQDGWSIEYQNYNDHNGYLLPGKIILKSEKVNLKLLVESWGDISATNKP
ncbi:MAG: outer membrane lipoprotein LolB [Betaproteobacteria bacterium]|nr:outer membrane lipoprotein LolB [Betaproteobacteria bacterium]